MDNTETNTGTDDSSAQNENIDSGSISESTLALLNGNSVVDSDPNRQAVQEETTKGAGGVEPLPTEKEPEPTQDPRFSKAFTALSRREKEVTQREAQIKERAAYIEEVEEAAQNYSEDPVNFIRKQIAAFTGSNNEADIDDAFGELFNQLTMHILGVDAPADMQEQNQYQKLQRDFERYKQEQADKLTTAEEQKLEMERSSKVQQAQSNIKAELTAASAEFPFLLSQDEQDPGELVWEIVWQDYNGRVNQGEENPSPMSVAEAAQKANEHFQNIAQKWASIIPNTAPQNTNAQPTGQPATNRPGSSRTLTNNNASIAPTRERESTEELDEDERLQRALSMIRLT